MKRKNAILLVVLPIITLCPTAFFLMSCPSRNGGNAELRQYFGESSIVVDNHESSLPVPKTIIDAALMACPLWAHHSLGTWPEYYIRTNGYTCAVWKWPITMWDLELKRMSDEFRVWVKDDTAEVVPTPSFSPTGNPNAKPPRLTAEKAIAIAEMKTGLLFAVTNVVEDVGTFFKIGFTPRNSLQQSPAPVFVWVAKSDWTISGDSLSPVPDLTEQEILDEIVPLTQTMSAYDREQPLKIDRVADMTIVTLPVIPHVRAWIPCIWIDNVTKKGFNSLVLGSRQRPTP